MRRANGDGTIYRRKDGRWEGAGYVRTHSGLLKRLRVYADSRDAARIRLNAVLAEADQGITVPDERVTTAAFLEHWLTTTVALTCRPRTVESYRNVISKYIVPKIGNVRLDSLNVRLLQQCVAQLNEAGVSIRLQHDFRKVLGAALTQAQREELIRSNPARLVRVPRYEAREVHPWTAEQLSTFLSAARTDPLYEAFVLLAVYGLRRSEVVGLRWQDVDHNLGVIRVRNQVQRQDGALRLVPVKTRAGARDLPIVPMVSAAVGDLAVGEPDEFLFATSSGRPVEPHNLARSFRNIIAKTDLPPITLHHVRHTTATLLARLHVPSRHAQAILGHANASTTQQIYQHASVEDKRLAVESIENALAAAATSERCRQPLPSPHFRVAINTLFQSGGPDGTRTHDTLLKSYPYDREIRSLTALLGEVRNSAKMLLLGAAAVSAAVSKADRNNKGQSYATALHWYHLTTLNAEP